jgi:hypothetical protein
MPGFYDDVVASVGLVIKSTTKLLTAVKTETAERIAITEDLDQRVKRIYDAMYPHASSTDRMVTKSMMDSSVSQLAATPVSRTAAGDPFPTRASLLGATKVYSNGVEYTPTLHDFTIIVADEGAPEPFKNGQTRFMFTASGWKYHYGINGRPFTVAEWEAIQSEVTKAWKTIISNSAGVSMTQRKVWASPKSPFSGPASFVALDHNDVGITYEMMANWNVGGSGATQYATNSEAGAGLLTDRAISPATLLHAIGNLALGSLGTFPISEIVAGDSIKVAIRKLQGQVNKRLVSPPSATQHHLAAFDIQSNIVDSGISKDDLALDDETVHRTGDETVGGKKTFTTIPVFPSKTSAAANNGTSPATEAQIYSTNSTLTAHDGNTTKHITAAERTTWNGKYTKPSGGILKTDLTSAVQASLNRAETAYQIPSQGIPKSDMDPGVQEALTKAGTALQSFTETDPTISAWAKSPTKPTYTYTEVGAEPARTLVTQATAETGTSSTVYSWSPQRVAQAARKAVLTGLSTATNATVVATDSILVAIGKLQKQITDSAAARARHVPFSTSTTWAGSAGAYTQSVAVSGVTATNDIEVSHPGNASDDQKRAIARARFQISQSAGYVNITATGNKPTISLPFIVTILN